MSIEIPKFPLFSSARTSPSKLTKDVKDVYFSEPTSPIAYDLTTHEFEFETSRGFNGNYGHHFRENWRYQDAVLKQENNHTQVMIPGMAFADELFVNGKLKPLEPPPGLKCITTSKKSNKQCNGKLGSTATSPRSPSARLKAQFLQWSRRSETNDDFDPFKVALENVREEKELQGGIHNTTDEDTRKETKRQQMKAYLFSYGFLMKKTKADENVDFPKQNIRSKFSLKSVALFHGRPKLPLCSCYGTHVE